MGTSHNSRKRGAAWIQARKRRGDGGGGGIPRKRSMLYSDHTAPPGSRLPKTQIRGTRGREAAPNCKGATEKARLTNANG